MYQLYTFCVVLLQDIFQKSEYNFLPILEVNFNYFNVLKQNNYNTCMFLNHIHIIYTLIITFFKHLYYL